MEMKHLILELYCDGGKKKVNRSCNSYENSMGIHCLQCEKMSYAKCPNEIAYSNEEGIILSMDDQVGFGGEMDSDDPVERKKLISTWEKICKLKIKEAYDEFMAIRS